MAFQNKTLFPCEFNLIIAKIKKIFPFFCLRIAKVFGKNGTVSISGFFYEVTWFYNIQVS